MARTASGRFEIRVLRRGVLATLPVKLRYFEQTDTLVIEFKDTPVVESCDLDRNTVLDVDSQGNICSITIEHASEHAGVPHFSYERIAA